MKEPLCRNCLDVQSAHVPGHRCQNFQPRKRRGAKETPKVISLRDAMLAKAFVTLGQAAFDIAKTLCDGKMPELTVTSTVVAPPRAVSPPLHRSNGAADKSELSTMERKILEALAFREPKPSNLTILILLTGYKPSGTFGQAIAALRRGGYLTGTGDAMYITAEGRDAAGPPPPMPQGRDAVLRFWANKLGGCEARILDTVTVRGAEFASVHQLAEASGYSASGSFGQCVGRLRALGMVTARGFKPSPELLEAMEEA